MRYFICVAGMETEVSKELYIKMEISCGFLSKNVEEITTDSFSIGAISGRVEYPNTSMEKKYYLNPSWMGSFQEVSVQQYIKAERLLKIIGPDSNETIPFTHEIMSGKIEN